MVEWKKLGETCTIITGGDAPTDCIKGQTTPSVSHPYPIYSNGDDVYGYSPFYKIDKDAVTISSIGNVGSVNYRNKNFTPIIRLKVVIPKTDLLSTKYLYYSLLDYKFVGTNSSLSSMKAADIKKVTIPVPSFSEQTHIVSLLDTFTSSIANLKQQITERRKQYEHYRDQLLDLEGKEGVEVKKLGEIAGFPKERISATLLNSLNYVSVENLLKSKAGRVDSENVPLTGNWAYYRNGDVLIGNIRPYLRKIWLADRDGGTNGDVLVIRPNEQLLPQYLYFVLASERFFEYYNQTAKGGKMPRGEKARALLFTIPIYPLQEQSHIVSLLDTFEASISNLEAQLKEREKQYEYYRNQLLSFK